MSRVRLLAISSLIFSTVAFAQIRPEATLAVSTSGVVSSDSSALTPLGPWNVNRNEVSNSSPLVLLSSPSPDDPAQRELKDKVARWLASVPFDPNSQSLHYRISPDGWVTAWLDDPVCYTIDSYVVARDKKNSDAVHPVSASTCQPGGRFHVKSAEIRVNSAR